MTMHIILERRRLTVASIDDAVALWEDHRDNHPIYGYAGCSEVGNGVTVYRDDQPIAKVSYNGRVWPV